MFLGLSEKKYNMSYPIFFWPHFHTSRYILSTRRGMPYILFFFVDRILHTLRYTKIGVQEISQTLL